MTRFYLAVCVTLLLSVIGQSKTVCSSIEKLPKGESKYIVEFYGAGEMPGGRNSFSTLVMLESGHPTYYSPCSARPGGYASIVKCDSSMGASASLLIESMSHSGAFQDGPLKLFNMKCTK